MPAESNLFIRFQIFKIKSKFILRNIFLECRRVKYDVVFNVDSSASVGDQARDNLSALFWQFKAAFNPLKDFEKVRQWIGKLVDTFDIEEDGGGTRVGVVIYSDAPRMEISLGNGLGKQNLIKAILVRSIFALELDSILFAQSLMYERGNTLTGESIRYASEVAFSETSGARLVDYDLSSAWMIMKDYLEHYQKASIESWLS